MKEENKRKIAAFIPYRYTGDRYEFYLQKRDMNAPIYAGMFSTFGGGVEEGESIEEALLREVAEELTYTPDQDSLRYFSRYETSNRLFEVFVEKVGQDFESKVDVQEGEYGAFLSSSEVEFNENASPLTRLIIKQLDEELRKGSI